MWESNSEEWNYITLCQTFVSSLWNIQVWIPKVLRRKKEENYKTEKLLHRLLVLILLQFTEDPSASRDINNLTRKKMFLSSLIGPWYWPETNKLFKTSVSVSSICVRTSLFVRLLLWKYRFTFTKSRFHFLSYWDPLQQRHHLSPTMSV